MILGDVKDKVKPGFRFVQPKDRWGPYNWEVVGIVERGVKAQMYDCKWTKAYLGHIHLVEWSATIEEVG